MGAPFRSRAYRLRAESRKAVQELLAAVGLNPEHYNRYPHEFSGVSGSGSASPELSRCAPGLSLLTSQFRP